MADVLVFGPHPDDAEFGMGASMVLDVGHTLAYPPSGNWFVPPSFAPLLQARRVPQPGVQALAGAVGKGVEYLDAHHRIRTEEEELDQFRAFYEMVLEAVGLRDASAELAGELASRPGAAFVEGGGHIMGRRRRSVSSTITRVFALKPL
jgi:hypothetical protein